MNNKQESIAVKKPKTKCPICKLEHLRAQVDKDGKISTLTMFRVMVQRVNNRVVTDLDGVLADAMMCSEHNNKEKVLRAMLLLTAQSMAKQKIEEPKPRVAVQKETAKTEAMLDDIILGALAFRLMSKASQGEKCSKSPCV